MDKEKDREAYEEMMVTVNQAKKEGNLEELEAIAKNPEKFLKEAGKVKSSESKTLDHSGDNSTKSARDEEKELLMTLDILLEDIKNKR